jgi:arylsulfatase A-like enzyme
MLDTWLGHSEKGRNTMLEESFTLAVRDGNWKYIAPQVKNTPAWLKNKKVPTGLSNNVQLYNLQEDPSEQVDVSAAHANEVQRMQAILDKIQQSGTRPGYQQ